MVSSRGNATDDETADVRALMDQLGAGWILTLATYERRSATPYASTVFYALAGPGTLGTHRAPVLLFASDPRSAHGEQIAADSRAAGAICTETADLTRIQGVQLRGRVGRVLTEWKRFSTSACRAVYLTRHPAAGSLVSDTSPAALYAFVVEWAKITDNRGGLGVHSIVRFPHEPDGPP